MNTVRQLLQDKGNEVSSIEPHNSVYNAMQLMAAKNIGALLVLETGKFFCAKIRKKEVFYLFPFGLDSKNSTRCVSDNELGNTSDGNSFQSGKAMCSEDD